MSNLASGDASSTSTNVNALMRDSRPLLLYGSAAPKDTRVVSKTLVGAVPIHEKEFNDIVTRFQAASRSHLFRKSLSSFSSNTPQSQVSPVPCLTHPTREARYAQAEAALRVALSRCDTEPSPLELQVRALDKGLRDWNARAGRGYERVQKAEEALAAAHSAEGTWSSGLARGSLGELQREKWMAMKERDEAVLMVEKIRSLIKELNTELQKGGTKKVSLKFPRADDVSPRTSDSAEATWSDDPASRKAAILFSGRLPPYYLQNLPRSRRSVEPLRLPLQVTNQSSRKRSMTLDSEGAGYTPSPPLSPHLSTSYHATTDEYGAALIYPPLPLKSMAQYLAEMENIDVERTQGSMSAHGHIKLPSYVDTLLDEFSKEGIGNDNLRLEQVLRSSPNGSDVTPPTAPLPSDGLTPPPVSRRPITRLRSKRFSNRPLGTPPIVPSSASSLPTQVHRSKENLDPLSLPPSEESRAESGATPFTKVLHTFTNTVPTTPAGASSLSLSAPRAAATSAPHPLEGAAQRKQIKGLGRIENMMQSVKKSVKRVSRMGE